MNSSNSSDNGQSKCYSPRGRNAEGRQSVEIENSVSQFNRYTNRVEKYPRPSHPTTDSRHADGNDVTSFVTIVRNLGLEVEKEVSQFNPYAKRIEQYPRLSQLTATNLSEKLDLQRTPRRTPIKSAQSPSRKSEKSGASAIHKNENVHLAQDIIKSEKNNHSRKRSFDECNIRHSSVDSLSPCESAISSEIKCADQPKCSSLSTGQENQCNKVVLKSSSHDSSEVRYVAVDVETHDWVRCVRREDYIGRIIQIAWVSYNNIGKVLDKKSHLIKPVGFTISRKAEQYHHITNETALRLGEDATVVLNEFVNVLKGLSDDGCVISHNMNHEDCCFARNLTPEQLVVWDRIPKVCTMTPRLLRVINSDHYWLEPGLPRKWGMKLVDLHRLMCGSTGGEESETLRSEAHDALADASMCGEIFFAFKRQAVNEAELLWQKDVAVGR